MAHSAVDSGRQRHLLQQAQALTAELRSLPLDPESTRQSYPRMFVLVRLVKRFIEATASMPADDTRVMWEQRGQWLQEEVAGLAQERIHSADQKQYWLNLILLLFAGADACDNALREKVELEARIGQLTQQVTDLQKALARSKQAELEAAQRGTVPKEINDELLELRAKVAVLQQQAERRRGEGQDSAQQLQMVVSERDALRSQLDSQHGELAAARELADSRLAVIQQLMASAESSAQRTSGSEAEAARLATHCKALAANLEANARVIEKLVELNAELMDTANAAAAAKARAEKAAIAAGMDNGSETTNGTAKITISSSSETIDGGSTVASSSGAAVASGAAQQQQPSASTITAPSTSTMAAFSSALASGRGGLLAGGQQGGGEAIQQQQNLHHQQHQFQQPASNRPWQIPPMNPPSTSSTTPSITSSTSSMHQQQQRHGTSSQYPASSSTSHHHHYQQHQQQQQPQQMSLTDAFEAFLRTGEPPPPPAPRAATADMLSLPPGITSPLPTSSHGQNAGTSQALTSPGQGQGQQPQHQSQQQQQQQGRGFARGLIGGVLKYVAGSDKASSSPAAAATAGAAAPAAAPHASSLANSSGANGPPSATTAAGRS